MKKTLIALAVLAASGASMAQSTVTLYGLADIWVGSLKTETTGQRSVRTTRIESGGVNTSRFGFRGTEDLGGGLKANFQLEQGFNLDSGVAGTVGSATAAFSRQSWVGLSGGFGEVQLGKVWTSYDDIRSSANDTFNANIASSFSVWVPYIDRTNNGLKYTSPTFGGFSGTLTYALGEDKTATSGASSIVGLGLQFANGPLFVGFSHQAEKAGRGTILASIPGPNAAPPAVQVVGTKATYNLLNGSYDFGVAKLLAGYNQFKLTIPGVAGTSEADEYNLGVEVPLSSGLKVALGYAVSNQEVAGRDVDKVTGFSSALVYNLSKRTSLYGVITQTKGNDLTAANIDTKDTLYAVGVLHTF